ncbi:MAG: alpha/beta fold hydrolase [Oscillospiraceae bacterium]|nr:alpha/beta fold hydrolase [Oscillospiraceae bacterium]
MKLFILLLVLSVALGAGMAVFSCHIRRQTLEQAMAWQAAHYDISWYEGMEKTDYTVKSYDGYELHVQFLANPERVTDRYVVLSHGYSDNRLGSLKYAMVYFHLGYNVIVYDLRGHGENKPTFCTYSARESRDLLALLEDTRTRYPEVHVLGIHGESLGAGTSIASLKEHPAVDFVVADCGFSEIKAVLKNGMKSGKLPEWPVDYASVFAKLLYGYSFDEMRPIDSLADNTVPILFIHGAQDDFYCPLAQRGNAAGDRGLQRAPSDPRRGACTIRADSTDGLSGNCKRFFQSHSAALNEGNFAYVAPGECTFCMSAILYRYRVLFSSGKIRQPGV